MGDDAVAQRHQRVRRHVETLPRRFAAAALAVGGVQTGRSADGALFQLQPSLPATATETMEQFNGRTANGIFSLKF